MGEANGQMKSHAEVVGEMHDEAAQLHEAYLGDPKSFEGYETLSNVISGFARGAEEAHRRELRSLEKSIGEIADEMLRFGQRHWMHDEGQNVRMFGERIKKILGGDGWTANS